MAAAPLPAISSTGWETSIALSADLFIAVVFPSQHFQRRLNNSATETKVQVRLHDIKSKCKRTEELGEVSTLSECCSHSGCGHPLVAFRRR